MNKDKGKSASGSVPEPGEESLAALIKEAGKMTITEKLLRYDWIMTRKFHVRYVRK